MRYSEWLRKAEQDDLDALLKRCLGLEEDIQAELEVARRRFRSLLRAYRETFIGAAADETRAGMGVAVGEADPELAFVSAPGRCEVIGNHTDHQGGRVMAASIHLDTWALCGRNPGGTLDLQSEGWPRISIDPKQTEAQETERNHSAALLRGVAAGFVRRGYEAQGLFIYTNSRVLPGSGLSSSASFELMLAEALQAFWERGPQAGDGRGAAKPACPDVAAPSETGPLTKIEMAQMGREAENRYFGKPSGLLDQMGSALGSAVYMDFRDQAKPFVERLPLNPEAAGYVLAIVDSGADHAALTDAYAAIPREMTAVAGVCGAPLLGDLTLRELLQNVPLIRRRCGDRALLRALHFFGENARVEEARKALQCGDFPHFLEQITASGRSSWTLLQNITPPGGGAERQALALTLGLAEQILNGRGAVRVHGGGFAGTVLAYVPTEAWPDFQSKMEAILGEGSCSRLRIRRVGSFAVRNLRTLAELDG